MENTSKPAKKLRYSYRWCEKVVEELLAKHSRATDFVEKIAELNRRKLAYILSSDQQDWNFVKMLIKRVDSYVKQQESYGATGDFYYTIVELAIKNIRRTSNENRFEWLDKLLERVTLEEQVLKCEVGKSYGIFRLPIVETKQMGLFDE